MPQRRLFTPEEEAKVLKRYQNGESLSAIARDLKVRTTTLSRIVNRLGVQTGKPDQRFLTDQQEQEVIRRYQAGETSTSIAKSFGCHQVTIRQTMRRHGLKLQPRGNRYREFTDKEVSEMARRWHAGESQNAIATSLGVHQAIVSRVLRQAGIDPTPRAAKLQRVHGWKGGRIKAQGGYMQVLVDRDDPLASMRNRTGYVFEHRLVMARHLGRPLYEWETVHHIDGGRTNNDISNLQLRQGKHGKGVVYRCLDCDSFNVGLVPLSEEREAYVASEYAAAPA